MATDASLPENMENFDTDSRSPNCDDASVEWIKDRTRELLNDISEIRSIEYETIGELVVNTWGADYTLQNTTAESLDDYFKTEAEKQAQSEWENK